MQIGQCVFMGASLLCGMASSLQMLIGLRAVQALGGCAMGANGTSLIANFLGPETRGIAFGYNSMVVGMGLSLGPPIGGLVTQYFGWALVCYLLPVVLLP